MRPVSNGKTFLDAEDALNSEGVFDVSTKNYISKGNANEPIERDDSKTHKYGLNAYDKDPHPASKTCTHEIRISHGHPLISPSRR